MIFVFFFFQAEDGIRDGRVTGVQTCALPISDRRDGANDRRQHALPWLPLRRPSLRLRRQGRLLAGEHRLRAEPARQDRKSTRLNSSHPSISYAVFCLKKKKNTKTNNLYSIRL